MQENYLIIMIVAIIAIVIISLFIIVVNLKKTVVVQLSSEEIKIEAIKAQKMAIEALVEIAAKRTSSRNDLTAAILKVAEDCPFPQKENGVAPKMAKIYLNFVLLVASHRNADAKLIAFMDDVLKNANPLYKKEIDIYENEGINQRGNRT